LGNTHVFSGSVTMNPGGLFVSSSGFVGIGTTSPLSTLQVGNGTQTGINGASNKIHIATTGTRSALLTLANSSGAVTVEGQFESSAESADLRVIIGSTSNHDVVLRSNNVERIRITSGSGNVGIGTSDPAGKLAVLAGTYQHLIYKAESTYQSSLRFNEANNGARFYTDAGTEEFRMQQQYSSTGFLSFYTGSTERMRITSNGFTKMSNNGTYVSGIYNHEMYNSINNQYISYFTHSGTGPYGLYINYTGASPNTGNYEFFACVDTTNTKAIIWSNGTFGSRTSTYGGISDIKLKENIVPTTPKLDDLLKVNVVNYNFIDDEKKEKQLGVISQELEQIFPNMVFESTDKDKDGKDLGTTTKIVKYSIFIPMLIKAIQEQQIQIQELSNRLIKAGL